MKIKYHNILTIAVISIGFTSVITQIAILREFLCILSGNELVIGIILANWPLITGLGSYFGKFVFKNQFLFSIAIFQVLIGILPLISIFLMNYLRNILFQPGVMLSLRQIFGYTLLIISPYCFVSGALFPVFSKVLSSSSGKIGIWKVYALESLGSLTGGFIMSLILILFLGTFQILYILLFINLIVAFWLAIYFKSKLSIWTVPLVLIITIVILSVYDPEGISKSSLFRNQKILSIKDTPYGQLVHTVASDQDNYFENGIILFSTGDVIEKEESVHFAMVQHDNPETVLLISGGYSGVTDEVLKYPGIEAINYLELDPELIGMIRDTGLTHTLYHDKINIICEDARSFLRTDTTYYDIVLINLPDPQTAQINRMYTVEFFLQLKDHLNKNGVISTKLSATGNYLSRQAAEINHSLHSTLKNVFDNVLIVPGGKNYFLASDGALSIDIPGLITHKKVDTKYVNSYYLDMESLRMRSDIIKNSFTGDPLVNSDYKPVTYFKQINYWLSYFNVQSWMILAVIMIAVILPVIFLNPVNLGLFTCGFNSISLEFTLLLSFQVIFGYLYQMIGVVITTFMAGLFVGSGLLFKIFKIRNIDLYIKLQATGAINAFIITLILVLIRIIKVEYLTMSLLLVLIATTGILTGLQFAVATQIRKKPVLQLAGESYGVELAGSALGAILTSVFLIPVAGIIPTCIIIGCLNVLITILIWIRARKIVI